MSKKSVAPAPQPDALPANFVGDEHWGKGGNYIVVDGKRVPAPADPDPAESVDPAEKGV